MSSSMNQPPPLAAARDQLAEAYERETATTLRVLRAYPEAESELRPHPRSKTARELAWMFTCELGLVAGAIRGTLDLGGGIPPAPDTMADVVASFERARSEALDLISAATDTQLTGTTRFFTAPRTMGEVPNVPFLWFLLHDQIHHRGQLSVYLRMAGGKVPSIYGPSADEPWT
jgi:uncharacterized damage-inducible protein DinB